MDVLVGVCISITDCVLSLFADDSYEKACKYIKKSLIKELIL